MFSTRLSWWQNHNLLQISLVCHLLLQHAWVYLPHNWGWCYCSWLSVFASFILFITCLLSATSSDAMSFVSSSTSASSLLVFFLFDAPLPWANNVLRTCETSTRMISCRSQHPLYKCAQFLQRRLTPIKQFFVACKGQDNVFITLIAWCALLLFTPECRPIYSRILTYLLQNVIDLLYFRMWTYLLFLDLNFRI